MENNSIGTPGPFTDTSPEAQDMLNTISNVIAGKVGSALPGNLENVAKQAGLAARGVKTIEDQQDIYKNAISKAADGRTKQLYTAGTVTAFERIANIWKNKK